MIAGRAVQGLGGGGLMSLALAVIGDIIPPRERGRYQGLFGAVFGVSSVAGPLLGGLFTDQLGWEWIFFINIPIGAAALVVTSIALKLHHVRRDARVDYLGAALIVGAVTSLILYLTWAGPDVGWTSATGLGLLVATVLLVGLFVLVERRAGEPIIPIELFGQWTFTSNMVFAMIMGVGMFGGLIYLPIYLQVVKAFSATESGLAMLPLVVGIFSTSISSGQIMSRTGRYKWMPITGSIVVGGALFALSRLQVDTTYPVLAVIMFAFGAGLGLHHAGRGDRGAEQRRPARHGRGHGLGDLLPLDGRRRRHRPLRSHPEHPARAPPGRGRPGAGPGAARRRRRGGQRHRGAAEPARTGQDLGTDGVHQRDGRRVPGGRAVHGGGPASIAVFMNERPLAGREQPPDRAPR